MFSVEKLVELLGQLDPRDLAKKDYRDTVAALIVASSKVDQLETRLKNEEFRTKVLDDQLVQLTKEYSYLKDQFFTLQLKAPRLDVLVNLSSKVKKLTANASRNRARIQLGNSLVGRLLNILTDDQLKQHADIINTLVEWRTKIASDPVEDEDES